jgi:hypothetical protein
MMPKNSLSVEYLKNLHVFRGNTHDFEFLPQFAPDQNIYEGLPEIDLRDADLAKSNYFLIQNYSINKFLLNKIYNKIKKKKQGLEQFYQNEI